jgi:hypothetical protein
LSEKSKNCSVEITKGLHEKEEFYILKDFRDENKIDKNIHLFSFIINQSYSDVLFDIMEFLPKKYYEEYFNALYSLYDCEYQTASNKLGFIRESFSHEAISEFILSRMKGVKRIGKARAHLSKCKDWSSKINTLKLIQKIVPFFLMLIRSVWIQCIMDFIYLES